MVYEAMVSRTSFAYGPVPSRRLGLSLGVDPVAAKSCPYDCLYCQLGPTLAPTAERREFYPVRDIVADVTRKLERGPRPDHITLGGSGEPTLHAGLGEIIRSIKAATDVPVALLTGGALLHDPTVRAEAALADVILPSLDAGDEELFALVNRPGPSLPFATMMEGLVALRREYAGPMWLEVMMLAGLSETPARLAALAAQVQRIRPDRVQLNTPVRPAKSPLARPIPADRLAALCAAFTPHAEVIADFEKGVGSHFPETAPDPVSVSREILVVLERRPCTVEDLAASLGLSKEGVRAALDALVAQGAVVTAPHQGRTYYRLA